jgi:hypothetical protein
MTIKIILDRLIAHILLIIEDCHAYRLPHCLTVAYRIAYHQNNTGSSHCRAYHLTAGLSHTVSLPHTSSHCRTHRLTAAHIVSLPRILSLAYRLTAARIVSFVEDCCAYCHRLSWLYSLLHYYQLYCIVMHRRHAYSKKIWCDSEYLVFDEIAMY